VTTRVESFEVLLLAPDTFRTETLAAEFGQAGVETQLQHITTMGELTSAMLTGDWNLILIAPAPGIDMLGAMNLVTRTGFRTPFLILPSAESSEGAVTRLFESMEGTGLLPASAAQLKGACSPTTAPAGAPPEVDLGACLERMDSMLRALAGPAVDFAQLSTDELLLLRAEPGEPETVLLALTANAVHAMPEGGRLLIETRLAFPSEVGETSEEPAESFAALAVTDTGLGMDGPTAGRAFEPLFSAWPDGRRAGFGLAQVRAIVESRGGRISLESQPGNGAIVRVLWPVTRG
jgi:hypothetical protein